MGRRGLTAAVTVVLGLALTGCGEDGKRIGDGRIVERLHLEQIEDGYAIDGDPFCVVEKKLLNDADELQDATDADEIGLVVGSRAGNAGVTGVAPFARDCLETARKRLDKLDPEPKDD